MPRVDARSKSRHKACRIVFATAPFQQQSIPGKGVGLIAAKDIAAGSVLLCEPALIAFTTFTTQAAEEGFALQDAVRRLSAPQRAAYYGLANSFGDRYSHVRHPALRKSDTVTPHCPQTCDISPHIVMHVMGGMYGHALWHT